MHLEALKLMLRVDMIISPTYTSLSSWQQCISCLHQHLGLVLCLTPPARIPTSCTCITYDAPDTRMKLATWLMLQACSSHNWLFTIIKLVHLCLTAQKLATDRCKASNKRTTPRIKNYTKHHACVARQKFKKKHGALTCQVASWMTWHAD